MGCGSFLIRPKKEEQQVPDSIDTQFVDIQAQSYAADKDDGNSDILEGIWGVDNEDFEEMKKLGTDDNCSHSQLTWDFMDWEGFANGDEEEEEEDGDQVQIELTRNFIADQESEHSCEKNNDKVIKKENNNIGFCGEDENRVSLKLNLNYQQVLDAWSDRGPLWADDEFSLTKTSHGYYYMGEVPVMEEEDRTRREASVMRYKEKRQSRHFSKKIRYQVRKLNADKRPRLKVAGSIREESLMSEDQ